MNPSPTNDPEFDNFYDTYPRRVGRKAARKAWTAALKEASAADILAGLASQLADLRARDPQYVPHPSTWLNAGRWNDEAPKPKRGSVDAAAARAASVIDAIQKGST